MITPSNILAGVILLTGGAYLAASTGSFIDWLSFPFYSDIGSSLLGIGARLLEFQSFVFAGAVYGPALFSSMD
jgi:hypothetical protein